MAYIAHRPHRTCRREVPTDLRRLALNHGTIKEIVHEYEEGAFENLQQALTAVVFALALENDRLQSRLEQNP